MYHGRMKGMKNSHYEAGLAWGNLIRSKGKILDSCPTFELTEEVYRFARECRKEYEVYFPKVLEEIQGIADGNQTDVKILEAMLFGMYCFEFSNKCTCFAISTKDEILFGRNSDFLVNLEKLYMNCLYHLEGSYKFNGNTTAFIEMEDGVNEHGLAVGLTFIYPHIRKPGLNAGMLTRYLLENCRTTKEALQSLEQLPIASAQTLTIADAGGDIAVVECNSRKMAVIRPKPGEAFVAAANNFYSEELKEYNHPEGIDDWRADDRYQTASNALRENRDSYSVKFAWEVLSGKYGFMCQYNRKTNADTVWSVVYDLKRNEIWRVEGNPSRKSFKKDQRRA